jgi:segregation and condensation protein A
MDYKVKLEIFEGPLDLLLYLIQKNELEIHDIPISLVTEQYLEYMNLMNLLDLDLAGEFLVMASMLMRIKSKMLLPVDETVEPLADEVDPRDELVQKLLEYMKYKEAAKELRDMESIRSDSFTRFPQDIEIDADDSPFMEGSMFDLITAFSKVLQNMPKDIFHQIIKDEFTVAEKVHELTQMLSSQRSVYFSTLFQKAKNRLEAITTFLALLELVRLKEVVFVQSNAFDDIEISKREQNTLEGEEGPWMNRK